MAWSRTSRHDRGYGTVWDKLRVEILERDHFLCQPCKRVGRVTQAAQVDHVKPKMKGGTDDRGNLQAICSPCHVEKTAREAADAQGRNYKPRVSIGVDGWPV